MDDYLLQARQMQALSFAVHIPLVCFGMAFPAMVLFCEWRYLRTGDTLFRTLARRWSKVMLALFAVGVVTGTILSFELGLLWPEFMARFADVFGLGFTLEGFSFFAEAIFITIYVYGWDRLPPRLHFLSGVPVAIAGVTGSLFVISVNGWMNHPGGFELRKGRAVDAHPWSALFGNPYFWHEFVHMYSAGYIVAGFVVATPYAWGFLRGHRGRYQRTALTAALSAGAVEQAAASRPTLVAVIVAVAVGAVVLVPSLILLFRLFLRGRLGPAATPGAPVSIVPVVARQSRRRLHVGFAGGTLLAGVGMTVFAGSSWVLALGVICLVACAIAAFGLVAVDGP